MEEKILFVKIFQPYAQYRNPFTFYYAQTYPLPPKSTILGMLQNCLDDWYGYNFNEMWKGIRVSIHGGFESIFWNYQSMLKGDISISSNGILINNVEGKQWLPLYGSIKSQRSPIYQQELFNGHLYVFLRGSSELIERIKENLEKPRKVLYLGRSEDVIFIKEVKYVEALEREEVEGDVKLKYPTYIKEKNFPIRMTKYPVYHIPVSVVFKNDDIPIKHKAQILKKDARNLAGISEVTKREVKFETVIYTGYDYSIILKRGIKIELEYIKVDNEEIRIIKDYGWL